MGQFTALPVGQGDAFLWEPNEERRVLVDGGRASDRAHAELLRRGVKRLDVMVCTHGDNDHTTGLLKVLDDNAFDVREVWVPARWGNGLYDVARDPAKVVLQLLQECLKTKLCRLDDEPDPADLAGADDWSDEIDLAAVEDEVASAPMQ